MLKNSLFQFSLSFSFSTAVLFPFLFSTFYCFGAAPLFLFLPTFLFFSVHVCPFFQPKNILYSPKQFSLQPQNIFFSPNVFQFFFSPNVFASAQNLFQFSPHHCFSLFLFCFSLFFFLLVLFSAHLFFLFSASFSSFFFSASFSFSCQLPRPKIFSLDASHFFYMNKSLFSSNLE